MARTSRSIWYLLGLNIQGDLADYTCYVDGRGQIIFFPKMPPEVPKNERQTLQRNRFRAAAANWQMLTKAERARWELATKRAHLKLTGYNLWTYYQTTNQRATIETIERQSGVTLL